MSTHDEFKSFAKGGIITGPSAAIPPWSECIHLGCELVIPVKVSLGDHAEEMGKAIEEALKRGLIREGIL